MLDICAVQVNAVRDCAADPDGSSDYTNRGDDDHGVTTAT
jgi:hypothetical protein